MEAANIDPQKRYVIKGTTLKRLLAEPKGTKGQINVRVGKDGEVLISFANPTRFRSVRNGVVKTYEIPAQEVDN